MGFLDSLKFSRLKEGLTKTRDNIVQKVQRIVRAKRKIDAELLDEIEEILITSDVGAKTSMDIIDRIRDRVKSQGYEDASELMRLLREEVGAFLADEPVKTDGTSILIPDAKRPYVVMIVGVNGVGKTTTIGKLAHNYKTSGYEVLIGAADTFRAAANQQLEIWAERAGVGIIQQKPGADPASVAFDTLQSAVARNADVVLIDTAGRLHTRSNLMEELKKIKRVMSKIHAEAPHEILLVLDATTGQNAIQQAKLFDEAVQLTGLVVTKLDGTAKGGVVIGISHEMKMPVKYIGVGEQIDDLQVFDRDAFVDALFGSLEMEEDVPMEEES